MISALPDPVYSRDFDKAPDSRGDNERQGEKGAYSQQSPIVAIGDGLWKPEYERRMKAEGEKEERGIVIEVVDVGLSSRK
jgi:hypothetical protein